MKCDETRVAAHYARRRVTVFHMQIIYISQAKIDLSAEILHTIFVGQRITDLVHRVHCSKSVMSGYLENASRLGLESD